MIILIFSGWVIISLSVLMILIIIARACGENPNDIGHESWKLMWFGSIVFPVGIFAIIIAPFILLYDSKLEEIESCKRLIKEEMLKERNFLWWRK